MLGELRNQYHLGKLCKKDYIEEMYKKYDILFDLREFIQNTEIKAIKIEENGIFFIFHDITIQIWRNDKRTAPLESLNFGGYETVYSHAMYKLLKGCTSVLDIGANIGWFSIKFSKLLGDKSTVYAFEPVRATFERLSSNIEINKPCRVIPFNIGFSNHEKEVSFLVDPMDSTSASERLTTESKKEEVSCKLQRLDDFVSQNRMHVDFIKCDVEGNELFVFQGGQKTIEKEKPVICTEMLRKWSKVFGYHPNEIVQLLNKMDYICVVPYEQGFRKIEEITESTEQTNFVFLHEQKHASILEEYLV